MTIATNKLNTVKYPNKISLKKHQELSKILWDLKKIGFDLKEAYNPTSREGKVVYKFLSQAVQFRSDVEDICFKEHPEADKQTYYGAFTDVDPRSVPPGDSPDE